MAEGCIYLQVAARRLFFYGYAEAAQLNVAVFETSPKDSLEHLDARSLRRTCNDLEEK